MSAVSRGPATTSKIASMAARLAPPLVSSSATVATPQLSDRRIAFTTPLSYGARLARLLHLRGAAPLPIPTITIERTPQTIAALRHFLSPKALVHFSSLLFTSRAGISAASLALADAPPPLPDSGETFLVAALGRDAELLQEIGLVQSLCRNPNRIAFLVPEVASPSGLVEALGKGFGRKALCPVPDVVGLDEPSVVPDFLRDLKADGWAPTRVPAYETRWAGPRCLEELVGGRYGALDAIVFTSTAEVEGMVKGLGALGWRWSAVREMWPEMVVAAHGPVTAKGAEMFGIVFDVISSNFSSFDGVLDALALRWADPSA